MQLEIENLSEIMDDSTIKARVDSEIVPEIPSFSAMSGIVAILLKGEYIPAIQVVVDPLATLEPSHRISVSDYKEPLSSPVRLTAEYFHSASRYRECFTVEADTLAEAIQLWHKRVSARKIKITPRGDITFPGMTFYLYYRAKKGGWQPVMDGEEIHSMPPVYLGQFPPRWRKAWDRFCAINPAFSNRDRDEAKTLIKIAPYEGTGLEVD